MEFNFVGAGYLGRSTANESEKCINWYLEMGGGSAKAAMSLIPTPGMMLFTTLAAAARGSHVMGGVLYIPAAGRLYSVTTAAVISDLGALDTVTGRVSMADNGDQLFLVDGTSGYTYTLSTTTFAKVTDAAFPAGTEHCDFIAGFFVVNERGTGKLWKSALNDGTSWNALDFVTAEADPDKMVRPFVFNDEIWCFGDNSIEPFYNSGAADFPFAKRQNAKLEVGTPAPWSVTQMDNSVFFLGQSMRGEKVIFRTQGYQKQRISNHAIEFEIDSYSTISDAYGFAYVEEGHSFYVLTFPTAGKTWVYDASIQDPRYAWHQRSSNDGRWLANTYSYFNGSHYVGNYSNGSLLKMTHAVFDENGTAIKRVRSSPHVHSDRERLSFNSLEIVFKMGVGEQTGQGVDPQAMLRISKDGGRTWGAEQWQSIGKAGDFLARAKWARLGMARDWVFEVTVTDPVDAEIVSATLK